MAKGMSLKLAVDQGENDQEDATYLSKRGKQFKVRDKYNNTIKSWPKQLRFTECD